MPLHPDFDEDEVRRVWVKNTWETAGNSKDAKYQLPVLGTHDIENLCYTIREFREHMPAARLHLTQGSERFGKFREVLSGVPRDLWDEVLAAAQEANCSTAAHFDARIGRP